MAVALIFFFFSSSWLSLPPSTLLLRRRRQEGEKFSRLGFGAAADGAFIRDVARFGWHGKGWRTLASAPRRDAGVSARVADKD